MQTVRIPELTYGLTQVTSLSPQDRVLLWLSGMDKTVYVELKDLGVVVGGSGGGSGGGTLPLDAVYTGGRVIVTITPAQNGQATCLIPALAGKDFNLELEGRPLYKRDPQAPASTDEYEVLSGGGFRLLGNTLSEGSRYSLDLFSLQQQQTGTPTAGMFSGFLPISANRVLSAADLGKLFQLRGGTGNSAQSLTVTLPGLSSVPANQVLFFETTLNNQRPHKIAAGSGAFIYVNGQPLAELYLHPGEVLWLLKGDDGFYVLSDYAKYYSLIGKPVDSYTVEADEVLLDGSLLSRAEYPRLWQKVQAFGASLVDENTWWATEAIINGEKVDRPYRGCWSMGTDGTNFRVPDWRDAFARGLKTAGQQSTSSTDTERFYNKAGGWQSDSIKAHGHTISTTSSGTTSNDGADPIRGAGTGSPNTRGGAGSSKTIGLTGGPETRPGNIGALKVTKF